MGWESILVLHVEKKKKKHLGTVVNVEGYDLARDVFCIANDHRMYLSVVCYY